MSDPNERLRYHVTGAIERGEAEAIVEQLEDEEEFTPEEDDAYIRPSGQLGARTSASFGGKFLGEYDDDDAALAAIKRAADDSQFWPNCWSVSDHGNINGPIDYGRSE